VDDGSAADRAGLQDGDLLVAVDKRPLEGVDALYDALEAAGADGELNLTVVRGEDEREVTVRFGEPAEVV
jgi:S1-C subfamily serine protease